MIFWSGMRAIRTWLAHRIEKNEFLVWVLLGILLYLVWGTLLRPYAMDFNIYRFAGYAHRDGLSPYDTSDVAFALAKKYLLVPFAPRFVYPPIFASTMAPLVDLPYQLLRGGFTLLSTLALFGSCWLIARQCRFQLQRFQLLGLLAYLPILNCIAAGQVNLFLLAVIPIIGYSITESWSARQGRARQLFGGVAFGTSIIVKPILYPLGIWLLLKRHWVVLLGAITAGIALVGISIALDGISPWLEYLSILRTFAAADPYVENQSLGGVIARLANPSIAQSIQFVAPIVVLGFWFLVFRQLESNFEIFALAALAVLLSPVAWYYYFVLLIPIFLLFSSLNGECPKWFSILLFVAYIAIEVHGMLWHRFPTNTVFVNLAFLGLIVLIALACYEAFQTNARERRPANKPGTSELNATQASREI